MKNSYTKITVQFIIFELLYLFLLKIGFKYLPHQTYPFIYLFNINIYVMITIFIFINYLKSKLNKILILQFFIWMFYLISISHISIFLQLTNKVLYLFYFICAIINSIIILHLSVFLFFYILNNEIKNKTLFIKSIITSIIFSILLLNEIFLTGNFINFIDESLNTRFLYFSVISFSFMIVMWIEFFRQKILLSEYLSNIMLIFTVINAIEILNTFSYESEMNFFQLIAQYFNVILNILMLLTWIARLNYLNSTDFEENEKYLKNYKKLQGIVDKPRLGFFVELYYYFSKKVIISVIILLFFIGLIIIIFNKIEQFIKYNILLLTIALVVSIIFAMVYWNKQWYSSINFLLKRKKKR